jgi:AraC-like DNA-binding protein
VQALHEYLSRLEGKLPTLSLLSKQFGLSARRLNEAFAAEYGQSIFAYITDQRLQAAHEVMVVTDEPMKRVAERLGYAHVNHFIAAFKRKYGYTPGQLRRGG